jgi:hypothetical protein
MNREVEFERLRQENLLLRQAVAVKEEQMKLLRQENLIYSAGSGKSGKNGMPRQGVIQRRQHLDALFTEC